MQHITHDPAPRRRWLVFGLATLMFLVLILLGIGLASPIAAAQGDDPFETVSTPEAVPTSDPFPATDGMTETVLAALEAYTQELAQPGVAASGPAGPVEIEVHWSHIHLPLVRIARAASPPPRPTPTTRPLGDPADMANTIWPAPSIRVVPGMTLEYEIRARNYGKGRATVDRVTLPYNKSQLTVETARFSKQGDWVSERTDDHVTVTFNNVEAGESRKATLVFRVNPGLVDGTVINMRATTSWSDANVGGSWRSNWAPLLAGRSNDSAPWAWLTVEPLGGYSGSNHRFFSDRFIPGEGVVTWLNTPTGVRALDLKGVADSFGRVTLDFRSTGLTPGTYSLVVYGARSNLTAIATFYIWQR